MRMLSCACRISLAAAFGCTGVAENTTMFNPGGGASGNGGGSTLTGGGGSSNPGGGGPMRAVRAPAGELLPRAFPCRRCSAGCGDCRSSNINPRFKALDLPSTPQLTNRGGEAQWAFFSDVSLGVDDSFQYALYQVVESVLPQFRHRLPAATRVRRRPRAPRASPPTSAQAFRRPLSKEEIAALVSNAGQPAAGAAAAVSPAPFVAAAADTQLGLKLMIEAILLSPSFVYRTELGPSTLTADASGKLSRHQAHAVRGRDPARVHVLRLGAGRYPRSRRRGYIRQRPRLAERHQGSSRPLARVARGAAKPDDHRRWLVQHRPAVLENARHLVPVRIAGHGSARPNRHPRRSVRRRSAAHQ